jgi:siroheme synthase-like protein
MRAAALRFAIVRFPSEKRAFTSTKRAAAVTAETPEPLFPAFLKLAGRRVLLVGGGPVAAAKARSLRDAGARITVVAPDVLPELRALVDDVQLRPFAPADLDGVWFVVAAAPPEVNRQVQAAAESRCLFVNAVDDPEAATAYAAAVIRRGPVTVALSTGGAAPALAGLIREGLESLLPEEMDRWGEVAQQARAGWKAEALPMVARRPRLLEALNQLYQYREGRS